jgi:hypothetical protein
VTEKAIFGDINEALKCRRQRQMRWKVSKPVRESGCAAWYRLKNLLEQRGMRQQNEKPCSLIKALTTLRW